ncbi:MAG: hypothetical protein RL385_1480 [Pseudomonadota bacterium]|jgi:hypothetical protein
MVDAEGSGTIATRAQDPSLRLRLSFGVTAAGRLGIVDPINAGEAFDAILPAHAAYPSLALKTAPLAREKLRDLRVALGTYVASARVVSGGTSRLPQ